MPDLLLEIGTEELPPSCVAGGEAQLAEAVPRLLAEARLSHGPVETFATPRRLAVVVREVAERQAPAVEERRGPPVSQAYDTDGSFTPAAVGFARAMGLRPEELVRRQTPQGDYLFAAIAHEGLPAAEVLPGLCARIIEGLRFPKTMRWDASGVRFPRPVRWLVALYGTELLDVGFGSVRAGRCSVGHRVAHPGPVEIPHASSYEEALRAAGVVARRSQRREAVRRVVSEAAAAGGGRAVIHDPVLDEVTDLVERPGAVLGSFDPAYLEIPREVLIVAMESHQRYFAVEDAEGRLCPSFVVVHNADPAAAGTIRAGNERVLRARLEDARFFWREDLKVPLSARTERLGEMVLHPQLGTMRDKVLRLGVLMKPMSSWLGLSDEDTSAAYYAADLCKADLLTLLVYEFPELQGIMGREYALRDPELASEPVAPKVAEAIAEHYLPRSATDELPRSPAGVALALADRLDTLVGYLGLGLEPTGSEDPFALRRAATGFVAISLERGARVPLEEAVGILHREYAREGAELAPLDQTVTRVRSFLTARAEAWLRERWRILPVLVEAAVRSAWADLPDLGARARCMQELQDAGRLHHLAVAHERCYNMARAPDARALDPAGFVHDAERNLYQQLVAVEEVAAELAARRDYRAALEAMEALSQVIDDFMDRERGVLVMDPDLRLRANRLALCERTAAVFSLVADFSVIHPALLEVEAGDRVRETA